MPLEEGEEFYLVGIFEFNITKLLAFIQEHLDAFHIEACSIRKTRVFSSKNLDEASIQKANLSNPILLGEISPNNFDVIDGKHRLERAYRDGRQTILAYRIFAEQHIRFLTSIKAYKIYVRYWNDKVKHLEKTICHQKNRVI